MTEQPVPTTAYEAAGAPATAPVTESGRTFLPTTESGRTHDNAPATEDEQSIIGDLMAYATQRDWLLIQQRLDANKEAIVGDMTHLFVALVWLKRKRDHGGAKFDDVLDLTDDQIYAELGIDAETAAAAANANDDQADDDDPAGGDNPNGLPSNGTATAPGSVSPLGYPHSTMTG